MDRNPRIKTGRYRAEGFGPGSTPIKNGTLGPCPVIGTGTNEFSEFQTSSDRSIPGSSGPWIPG